jgi:hypothetical protein
MVVTIPYYDILSRSGHHNHSQIEMFLEFLKITKVILIEETSEKNKEKIFPLVLVMGDYITNYLKT